MQLFNNIHYCNIVTKKVNNFHYFICLLNNISICYNIKTPFSLTLQFRRLKRSISIAKIGNVQKKGYFLGKKVYSGEGYGDRN